MTIRPAKSSDIPFLAEYWYDQMALLSQKSKAIRLAPDARLQWESHVAKLLKNNSVTFLVAEHEGEILGAIIGQAAENIVGLLPKHYGLIVYLIVDMHSPYRQNSFVGQLLDALKKEFKAQGLNQLKVSVIASSPIEQGYWRGIGAILLEESYWMSL